MPSGHVSEPQHNLDWLWQQLTEIGGSSREVSRAEAPLPELAGLAEAARTFSSASRRHWPGRGLRLPGVDERGPILVRVMRTEARCRWINKGWHEFTGRNLKQAQGCGWMRDVHPEDRARLARVTHQAFRAGELYRVEYRLRRAGGEHAWVLEIGIPRLTYRGKVGGFVGTAIEISERKQAETRQALQNKIARVLSEAKTLETAGSHILRALCDEMSWEVGELWSVDPGEHVPRCTQVCGTQTVDVSELREVSRTRRFPTCSGATWESGQTAWIPDISADPCLALEFEAQRLGLHSMFRLPVSANGEVLAVLRLFCRKIRPRDDGQVKFLTSLGAQISEFLERLRSEERVRESELRKAAILEATLDAVIVIDHEGLVVEFNAAAERIFGYPRQDALGRNLASLIVPARLRTKAAASFAGYHTQVPDEPLGQRFAAIAARSDGSEFPVDVARVSLPVGDPPLLTIFVSDLTARQAAEDEVKLYQARLRGLTTDHLLAEEHERRRLASDLSDGLSQTIALTQIKLSALRRSLKGQQLPSLDELEGLIHQTDKAVRALGSELSPPALHDLGLAPALQRLIQDIQPRYGVEIVLKDDGLPEPADETTRVILFRSIRELLVHAARHAGARHLEVRLEHEEGRMCAFIEDDGAQPETARNLGSALFSVQERLNHVGGSMRIDSAPGRGMRIYLSAPLTNGETKKARVLV